MNHDYDATTGKFTPRGGATPDGGNNPPPDASKAPLGTGMARKAADKLQGRKSQLDALIDSASE